MTTVHPAADLFPMLPDDELKQLAEDIKANGLREPVVMWANEDGEEVLLDGRNRLAACRLVDVKAESRHYEGDDPVGFIVSANIKRRHLTAGQRAAIAASLEPLFAEEAAKRVGGRPRSDEKPPADLPEVKERESRERAAKMVGASGRAVSQFKRVLSEEPELAEKVRSGAIALDRAERIVRDRLAEKNRQAEQLAVESTAAVLEVHACAFINLPMNERKADAIITDPPYGRDAHPDLALLAVWADQVLTEDGVLAVMMGQMYLPEVFRLFDAQGNRPYRWTACYMTPGPAYVAHSRKVHSNWKPLLIYGGGRRFSDCFLSKIESAPKHDHVWGQGFSGTYEIVERLTRPGDLVVDPFMGSGTVLKACQVLGRHAIGCDIDEAHVETAAKRLGLNE